eukprot:TRINITY_DN737_c0_g3_i1.p1 TRINITY_DN737_c0_g3~~TRINITY_DN737_c0_g3_i1.p1  ORF type:complete len:1258 (+),score=266.02 TRINITY_DN737_c0_g3_i1:243-4016(+)
MMASLVLPPAAEGSVDPLSQTLLAAIESDSMDEVEKLVESFRVSGGKGLNWAKKGVGSPLVIAIRRLNVSIVSLLLDMGASPNFNYLDEYLNGLHTEVRVVIPFHVAYENYLDNKHSLMPVFDILRLLIKAGADINVAKEDGWTVLHMAVKRQQEDMTYFLIEQGANPRLRSRDGTALEMACMRQVVEQVWDQVETKVEVLKDDSFPKKLQNAFVGQLVNREIDDQKKSLDLSECILESLPKELLFGHLLGSEYMSFTPWLTSLNLRKNELEELPIEIGLLHNLEELDVSQNKLSNLPTTLPELTQLVSLNISFNAFQNLPDFLGLMTSIKHLNIDRNPLKKLPNAARRLTNTELLKFLHDASEGTTSCVQTKLIVVGQEAVGKTTLLRSLNKYSSMSSTSAAEPKPETKPRRNSFKLFASRKGSMSESDLTLPSTDGIEITQWQEKDIMFQCWDFGGQLSFYAMHQYYLTQNSIYLICFDLEREETINRMEYWIKTIKDIANKAPILIVGTHADAKKCTKEHISSMFASVKQKYSFVKFFDFIAIGIVKGIGLKQLKKTLTKIAEEQTKQTYPKKYLLLRERVIGSRPYFKPPVVRWSRYAAIGEQCGIDEADLITPTNFLHEMGVLFYFNRQKDATMGLSDYVILDPMWMTKAMTSLVSFSHSFGKKDGILTRKELSQIWREPLFPEYLHDMLLALLEKFEVLSIVKGPRTSDSPSHSIPSLAIQSAKENVRLSKHMIKSILDSATIGSSPRRHSDSSTNGSLKLSPIQTSPSDCAPRAHNNDRILVPSLLPSKPITNIADYWPEKASENETICRRDYTFPFIPHGFFGRVIVRIMRFTTPVYFWRNGIISEYKRKHNSQRLFIEMVTEKDESYTMVVQARGSNPSNLIHSAIECIDKLIEIFYSKLLVTRHILCPSCIAIGSAATGRVVLEQCWEIIFANAKRSKLECPNGHLISVDVLLPALFLNSVESVDYNSIKFDAKKVVLGRGSFATVYLGNYKGEAVAVKDFHPCHSDADTRAQRSDFANEVTYLSSIKHECIIRFIGLTLNPITVISEYIPHGALYSYLGNRANALAYPTILKISYNIVCAVHFLHKQNPPVLHRDLKTPNVLINTKIDPTTGLPVDSSAPIVKLADLGCSCKVVSDTLAGEDIVNADWLAPEVILEYPFTEKADIYSLGIIFWELVARAHPFSEFSFRFQYQKADAIAKKGMRPTIPESTPSEFRSLIKNSWAQSPDDRPSASQLRKKLVELLQKT